jgi:hypothetical protein
MNMSDFYRSHRVDSGLAEFVKNAPDYKKRTIDIIIEKARKGLNKVFDYRFLKDDIEQKKQFTDYQLNNILK